jgi:hypothetical protein
MAAYRLTRRALQTVRNFRQPTPNVAEPAARLAVEPEALLAGR